MHLICLSADDTQGDETHLMLQNWKSSNDKGTTNKLSYIRPQLWLFKQYSFLFQFFFGFFFGKPMFSRIHGVNN